MTGALFHAANQRGVRVLLNGFGGDSAASFSGTGSFAQFVGRWVELARQQLRGQNADGQTAWRMLMRDIVSPLSPDFVFRSYLWITGKKPLDWLSSYSIHPAFGRRMGLDLPHRNTMLPRACDRIIDYMTSGQLQEIPGGMGRPWGGCPGAAISSPGQTADRILCPGPCRAACAWRSSPQSHTEGHGRCIAV